MGVDEDGVLCVLSKLLDAHIAFFKNRKIDEMREEHSEYLANRKQEALDAQTLMMDIAERKKKQEEKKSNGNVCFYIKKEI